MTKSELKNTLRRVNVLDQEIKCVDLKIERLEACLQGHAIRYDTVHVQTSPKDAMAEVMAEIEPLRKDRDRLTVAITKAIMDTSRIIDMLKDGNQKLVMHYRYTACLQFEDIAQRMNYSQQRVFQLHDDAMQWLLDNTDIRYKKHKH